MFVNGHNRPTRLNTEKDEDQQALKIMQNPTCQTDNLYNHWQ
jgi:hypothetical protein